MGLVNKIKQAWGIEELKNRILNTLLFLLVYRLGSFVIIPGVDSGILSKVLENQETNNMIELINQFAGGAFSRASIFALGVMPYITASIIIQLMSIAYKPLENLKKEGINDKKFLEILNVYILISNK